MNKKLLGIFIPLGVIATGALGGIALEEEINEQCNYMLTCCNLSIEGIKDNIIRIDKSNLNEDEKAKICKAIIVKMNEALNLVADGRASNNIFKRKKLYKKADKLLKDMHVNLTIDNYGWFYN